jgi:hypothetical protein
MGLHVAAWILINWLLTVAWLDSTRLYFIFWAGVVVLFWWFGWIRRNPPWPSRPEERLILYGIFFGSSFMLAFFINLWQAYLIPLEYVILWIVEQRRRRQRTA